MNAISHKYLISALLSGQEWFENSLQAIIESQGFQPANKSQAAVLAYMSAGEFRPSSIARRMRLSRQAISHIVKSMVDDDLVVVTQDEFDRRSKRLEFSPRAQSIREASAQALQDLEVLLERRIGSVTVADLRRALTADWGQHVSSRDRLDELLTQETSHR